MAKKKGAKKTKKQLSQEKRRLYFITGLIFILLGLFGSLQLGFLGTLIANVLRVIGGNTFILLGIALVVYGAYLVLKGEEPKLKRTFIVGATLFYVGLLLFLHALWFKGVITPNTHIIRRLEKTRQD